MERGEQSLLDSLYRDAKQSQHYGKEQVKNITLSQTNANDTEWIARVYETMGESLKRQAGYPRLYREAWITLSLLVANKSWATLLEIDQVFDAALPDTPHTVIEGVLRDHGHQFSAWHLKTVLYEWSRGGSTILNETKKREDKLSMIAASNAFVNMTPQEAQVRLAQTHLNNLSSLPYLFRVSTTEPGMISLSYLTPVSNRALHRRYSGGGNALASLLMLSGDIEKNPVDIYRLMVAEMLDDSDQYGVDSLVLLMRKLDPSLADHAVRSRLSRVQLSSSLLPSTQVYPLLRRLFFPHITTKLVAPQNIEERVGLTQSYTDSYVSLSTSSLHSLYAMTRSLDLPCHNCLEKEAAIKEPVNNNLYCDQRCYDDDFVLCY
jgi:hypothetical protein